MSDENVKSDGAVKQGSSLTPGVAGDEGWNCQNDNCDNGSKYGEAPAFIEEDGGKKVCGDCFDEWFENNV